MEFYEIYSKIYIEQNLILLCELHDHCYLVPHVSLMLPFSLPRGFAPHRLSPLSRRLTATRRSPAEMDASWIHREPFSPRLSLQPTASDDPRRRRLAWASPSPSHTFPRHQPQRKWILNPICANQIKKMLLDSLLSTNFLQKSEEIDPQNRLSV